MNNKFLGYFSLVFVVALIGWMSWRDMHPATTEASALPKILPFAYYIDETLPPQFVPDGKLPLILSNPEMETSGINMREIFVQRTISPVYKAPFDFEKIKASVQKWKKEGALVNVVVLEDTWNKAPSDDALSIIQKLRDPRERLELTVFTKINLENINEESVARLKPLSNEIAGVIVAFEKDEKAETVLQKVKSMQMPYQLLLPAGITTENIDADFAFEDNNLRGHIVTADETTKTTLKRYDVQLLPQF